MDALGLANYTGDPVASAQTAMAATANFGYPPGVKLIDMVPDHLRPFVHQHWHQFPPVNPMWHFVLGAVYGLLCFVSFFGNGLVILLFNKHDPLKTPSNFLVCNLALADMVMLITNGPPFIVNCYYQEWSYSMEFCRIYAACGAVTGVCSIYTLVCISFDRYNIICNGFNGPKLTKGKATMMAAFCWFMAGMVASPPFFGWGNYTFEGIMTACSFDFYSQDVANITFNFYMVIVNYCIPVSIIIFSYAMIVKSISAHEASMRAQAAKMNVKSLRTAEANEQRAEIRIAKTALFNIALWLAGWTPYATITLQGSLGKFEGIRPLTTIIPSLMAKSISCYNPFVYAIGHPKYRQAMTVHYPGFCIHEPEAKADDASAAGEKA